MNPNGRPKKAFGTHQVRLSTTVSPAIKAYLDSKGPNEVITRLILASPEFIAWQAERQAVPAEPATITA